MVDVEPEREAERLAAKEAERAKPITRGEIQGALKSVIGSVERSLGDEPRGVDDAVSNTAKWAVVNALEELMEALGLDRWDD